MTTKKRNPRAKAAYAVGYCRPPVEHRFTKGQSGNPRGRPRKPRPISTEEVSALYGLVLKEAYRKVSAREGDVVVEMTVIEAMLRRLGLSGMKDDRRAQLAFTKMVEAAETAKAKAEEDSRRKGAQPSLATIYIPNNGRDDVDPDSGDDNG